MRKRGGHIDCVKLDEYINYVGKGDFMINRFKNPYLIFGAIATVLATLGIEPSMLQEWEILQNEMLAVLSNPYKIGCLVVALVGIYVDPTSKGLKDREENNVVNNVKENVGGKRYE